MSSNKQSSRGNGLGTGASPKLRGQRKKARALYTVILVFANIALAETPSGTKIANPAEEKAVQMRERILAESHALTNHPWAGQYGCGYALTAGATLYICPGSGYVIEWEACLGVHARTFGNVMETNGHIRLSFSDKEECRLLTYLNGEMFPVQWGERRYLIPYDDVIGFCNAINNGSEPRGEMYGWHLLRDGDHAKPVSGFPAIPAEFRPYLLAEPITAEIMNVDSNTTEEGKGEWAFRDTFFTLNAGRERGLLGGMQMVVVEPDTITEKVYITEVQKDKAIGRITQFATSPMPAVGWGLATRRSTTRLKRKRQGLASCSRTSERQRE